MHFSTLTVLFGLTVSSLAMPFEKRANSTSDGVLTSQSYNDFSVSGGVGGNALAEVNAAFPVRFPSLGESLRCL